MLLSRKQVLMVVAQKVVMCEPALVAKLVMCMVGVPWSTPHMGLCDLREASIVVIFLENFIWYAMCFVLVCLCKVSSSVPLFLSLRLQVKMCQMEPPLPLLPHPGQEH